MKSGQHEEGQITIIGEGMVLEGSVTVPHPILVSGVIKGNVKSEREVTITLSGKVNGDIIAKIISIEGHVEGHILASDLVVLGEKSSLIGDLKTAKLVVEEGACFTGNCTMEKQDLKK